MELLIFRLPRVLSVILLFWWASFIYQSHGFSIESTFEWIFWGALLASTITSWKIEFLGGSIYLFLGFFYILIGLGRVSVASFLVVPFPLLLTGFLFILAGYKKKAKKECSGVF